MPTWLPCAPAQTGRKGRRGSPLRIALPARRMLWLPRYIMNSGYTEEIWQKQQTFLGCEICQTVCPKNARLKKLPVPDDTAEAFELRRLIAGNAKAARIIAGKNITGNGRLTMEAIALAVT